MMDNNLNHYGVESPSYGTVNPEDDKSGYTLDQRRRAALADVDNATFSWFHVKVVLVAGVGFFTDAYDIFAINIASTMLGYVYTNCHDGNLPTELDFGVKIATPVGTLVGQLLFGWLADMVGRKRMYGIELLIIINACFAQTLAGQAQSVNVFGVIIVWRFLMGIGIGGDCPLSAVISSEFSSTRIRGRLMTAVFAAQGWGNFTAAVVATIIVAAFKNSVINDDPKLFPSIDTMWRLLIGLGCVPACVALYFRLTIPETPRFTMDIERNIKQASVDVENFLSSSSMFMVDPDSDTVVQRVQAPVASWSDFMAYFGKRENLQVLIGTSWSWFALDIAFYGLSLNSSIILTAIGFGEPSSSLTGSPKAYENLKNVSIGNIILAICGLIPGFYVTFFFIDSWGRRPIQLMGFGVLTVLFAIMGFGYNALTGTPGGTRLFVFLYCLANFFSSSGPNTTTFVVPGKAFPTRYRSTAHGISAASGKLGAIIAQVLFSSLKSRDDRGDTCHTGNNKYSFVGVLLAIFAFFMLTGVFSTLLLPETKGRSLEDLSNESQEGFVLGPVTIPALEARDRFLASANRSHEPHEARM